MKNIHVLNQQIYITTDEKIKEGDWIIDLVRNEISKANGLSNGDDYIVLDSDSFTTANQCKKIVLTTDQYLIKDGVQAIDDEFLEWFVKNPTCENIPIITTTVSKESTYKTNIGFESWRKEEPSQDKRMYSEKELFQIIAAILHTPALRDGSWEDIGEWFEQFKKK